MLRHSALRKNLWLCLATLILCLPVTVRGEGFIDGFENGLDNWRENPEFPGIFDATSGDLIVESTTNLSAVLILRDIEFTGDVSARTRVAFDRSTDGEAAAGVFVHGGGQAYLATFGFDAAGQTELRLWWFENGPGFFERLPLPAFVPEEDHFIQLDVRGETLEVRWWEPGDGMPVEPQLSVDDERFGSGTVGVIFEDDDGGKGTFRSFQVSDTMITEGVDFLDGFENGLDNWRENPEFPGIFDATSGDLVVESTTNLSTVLILRDIEFTGDVSVRTQVAFDRSTGGQARAGVFVHGGGQAYLATFGFDAAGQTELRLWWFENGPGFFERLPLPAFVPEEDHFIQLDVRGEELEVRWWEPGDGMRVEPQLSVDDERFRSGTVGVIFDDDDDDGGKGTFRFFQVSDTMIMDHATTETLFLRGECNDDGAVDVSDARCILNWQFLGGPAPGCLAAANTNGDKGIDIADAIYLLGSLFLGGPPPAPPFPACGPGTLSVDDQLGCEAPSCQ